MEGVLGRRYDSTAKHVHVCVLICTTQKILEWWFASRATQKKEKKERKDAQSPTIATATNKCASTLQQHEHNCVSEQGSTPFLLCTFSSRCIYVLYTSMIHLSTSNDCTIHFQNMICGEVTLASSYPDSPGSNPHSNLIASRSWGDITSFSSSVLFSFELFWATSAPQPLYKITLFVSCDTRTDPVASCFHCTSKIRWIRALRI